MRRFRRRRGDFITAHEIACFAYSPESWRLQYGLERLPTNQAALDAGTRHHERKAVAERIAGGRHRRGQCCDCGVREHCGQARL